MKPHVATTMIASIKQVKLLSKTDEEHKLYDYSEVVDQNYMILSCGLQPQLQR